MSIFVHPLTIVRTTRDETDLDERGQPTADTVSTATVQGLVQPRSAREVLDSRSAGSEIGEHVIFLPIGTDIKGDDYIDWHSERYQVSGIRRFDFGALAHLEVDARLIVPATNGSPFPSGGSGS